MKTPEEVARMIGQYTTLEYEVQRRMTVFLTAWRDECVVEHDMRIAESKRLRTEMEPPV
jgi:hypothetical protein